MKENKLISDLNAIVRIPGSKSITHRAIIAASLAQGRSVLTDFLECEDTRHTIHALRQIGVPIAIDGTSLLIQGRGGKFDLDPAGIKIHVGNSGTSLRLLLSVVSLLRGQFLITGTKRMRERPVGPLVEALNDLGADASCVQQDGCPPVDIRANGLRGGRVSINGSQSSQFLSSLLLAGPYADTDIDIDVTENLISKPYVDMTVHVMKHFGVFVDRDRYRRFKIPSGQKYQARWFGVQGDASSASYFWAAAAVTGGTVATCNIDPHTTWQGDIGFLEILERMGCIIEKGSDRVIVHGRPLSGIEVDMGDLPDMAPTLAAVALFAKGRTVIHNVAHLRHKESDRLHDLAVEWGRIGAQVKELPDGLVIHGGEPLSPAIVNPHDDHRLAMSLAVIGLRVPRLRIRDQDCVKKSFPSFWRLWNGLQGDKG